MVRLCIDRDGNPLKPLTDLQLLGVHAGVQPYVEQLWSEAPGSWLIATPQALQLLMPGHGLCLDG